MGTHRSGADAHAAAAVPEVHCKGADYAALDGKPISELAVFADCGKDEKGKAGLKIARSRRNQERAVPEPVKRVPPGFGTTLYMHFDSDRVLKFEPSISTSGLTCGDLQPHAEKPGEGGAASGEQKTQGPAHE